MGRLSLAVASLAVAALTAGCGDPLVVLGDTPGLMRVVLGIGDSVGTHVDTVAVRTRLREPQAVAFHDDIGVFYAADRGANRTVNGINTRVARIFSVTSRGSARLVLDAGGCSTGTCIVDPVAMVESGGTLIIADAVGHRVVRYVPGAGITVLAGTGVASTSPDGSPAAQSPVNRPSGVAIAPDGRVVFSEGGANRVRVIEADGRLTTLAGNGSSVSSGDGGAATAAGIFDPAGITYLDGTLYIAEYGSGRVRALRQNGIITTAAGVGVHGFSGDGGSATDARLDHPIAVTGTAQTLFISDQGNHRVRAVDLATGIIRTFAGTGDTRYSGPRRAAGETSLSTPWEIEAAAGFLFIVDRNHSVIWRTSFDFN